MLTRLEPALRACRDGACENLLGRTFQSTGENERKALIDTFRAGCELGSVSACSAVEGLTVLPDTREAALLQAEKFETRCAAGDSFSCARWARLAPATEASVEQIQGNCERLGGWACYPAFRLAVGMRRPDPTQWLIRGCDGGDAIACFELGLARAEGGHGLEKDLDGARAAYQEGCDGQMALACNNLGWMLQGAASEPDAATHDVFSRACELGDATACDHLADLEATGPEDVATPSKYCDLWGAQACFQAAARLTASTDGESPDHAEQLVRFGQNGCRRGHRPSCNAVQHLARDHIAACNGGRDVPMSCTYAAFAHQGGLGDGEAAAREAFEKACEAGATVACSQR